MDNNRGAYRVVLSDLRRQRAEIDAAIRALERLQGDDVLAASKATKGMAGMTIADAAHAALSQAARPLKVQDILGAILEGGVVMNSRDNANTLGSILARRERQIGDVRRVGRGLWAVAAGGELSLE